MNVLLVGAGAVGQVYGFHLGRAGARVSYFVKPKHVAECQAGFTMIRMARKPQVTRFSDVRVYSDLGQLTGTSWDQVWLCVASSALRTGWLDGLLAATGDAAVVVLQPGMDDLEYVRMRAGARPVIQGLIGFSAWHAPLGPDDHTPEGLAYWFPPLVPSVFGGQGAKELVALLRAGGCPARFSKDTARAAARGAAMFIPLIAALEASGWSFARLLADETLSLGCAAAREAVQIAAPGATFRWLPQPWMVRVVMRAARALAPFDMETFLKVHFTKVGAQTREILDTYLTHGNKAGAVISALSELRGQL